MMNIFIDVVHGPEGPSLNISDENSGHRLAGPKAWGGGQIIHRFEVDAEELIRETQGLVNAHEEKDDE